MSRHHASVLLRRLVDEAVGPDYDAVFLRLDLVGTSRAARCGCAGCSLEVGRARAAVLAHLPSL